jgi:hypothetical protein
MKYIKLKLSFGDKLKLLFFGIIPEDKLPEKEVVKEVEKIVEKVRVESQPVTRESINIKDEEEEFHVPFFELQDDDVKSNF